MKCEQDHDRTIEVGDAQFRKRYVLPFSALAAMAVFAATFGSLFMPSWMIYVTIAGAVSAIVMLGARLNAEAESLD